MYWVEGVSMYTQWDGQSSYLLFTWANRTSSQPMALNVFPYKGLFNYSWPEVMFLVHVTLSEGVVNVGQRSEASQSVTFESLIKMLGFIAHRKMDSTFTIALKLTWLSRDKAGLSSTIRPLSRISRAPPTWMHLRSRNILSPNSRQTRYITPRMIFLTFTSTSA